MSDFEDSDSENDELKKEPIDNYDDLEKDKQLSKKLLNLKIDSEDDEDNEDDDVEINTGVDNSDDDDDDDDDIEELIELNEDEITTKIKNKEKFSVLNKNDNLSPINSDVESDDDENLQKFDYEFNNDFIKKYHKESLYLNNTEIEILTQVTRDEDGIIIDNKHKTVPILTKYERAKILGQRAKQINNGHKPFINVENNIIDSYLIAELELKAKKIPFIIKRPIIGGDSEYWKLKDLEQIY